MKIFQLPDMLSTVHTLQDTDRPNSILNTLTQERTCSNFVIVHILRLGNGMLGIQGMVHMVITEGCVYLKVRWYNLFLISQILIWL